MNTKLNRWVWGGGMVPIYCCKDEVPYWIDGKSSGKQVVRLWRCFCINTTPGLL